MIFMVSPFTLFIDLIKANMEGQSLQTKLSDLKDYFYDTKEVEKILNNNINPVIYEVKGFVHSQHADNELNFGITILYPGIIGKEFYFTKGHYHIKDFAEVYIGLKGKGLLLLQSRDGDFLSLNFGKNIIAYIPPGWAHRVVNISSREKLVWFGIFSSTTGHDYETIRNKGFAKLVLKHRNTYKLVSNPKFRH
jgi:glucose-6-phosphate isomerase